MFSPLAKGGGLRRDGGVDMEAGCLFLAEAEIMTNPMDLDFVVLVVIRCVRDHHQRSKEQNNIKFLAELSGNQSPEKTRDRNSQGNYASSDKLPPFFNYFFF